MAKHKIVVFTDNKAKVLITNDPEAWRSKEDGKTVFIDPNLGLCHGVSPEHWMVKDGIIMPIEDQEELAKRNAVVSMEMPPMATIVPATIVSAELQVPIEVKANIAAIKDLQDHLGSLQNAHSHLKDHVKELHKLSQDDIDKLLEIVHSDIEVLDQRVEMLEAQEPLKETTIREVHSIAAQPQDNSELEKLLSELNLRYVKLEQRHNKAMGWIKVIGLGLLVRALMK